MSQYGAYGYALHGWTYQQILAHYYTGTQIGTTKPEPDGAGAARERPGGVRRRHRDRQQAAQPEPDLRRDPAGQRAAVRGQPDHAQAGRQVQRPADRDRLRASESGGRRDAYRGSFEFRPNGIGRHLHGQRGRPRRLRPGRDRRRDAASWAPQALETQAVAARTYAITTDVDGGFFNLYPDTRSQMYRGVAAETPSTVAAVAATAGQIVTYNGAPAVTYFFASSGGYTEDIEDAWPGATAEPWLRRRAGSVRRRRRRPVPPLDAPAEPVGRHQGSRRARQGQAAVYQGNQDRCLATHHEGEGGRGRAAATRSPAPSSRARSGCSARGRASPRSRAPPAAHPGACRRRPRRQRPEGHLAATSKRSRSRARPFRCSLAACGPPRPVLA